MPTTRNTLLNSSHIPLTYINVQVLCNTLQNYLSPHKHHYLVYYLRPFLRILKFGYPASNIAINSSTLSRDLNLCVTPFSLQYLTIYRIPITILDNFIGTMNKITNVYIDAFLINTLVLGHNTNVTQTNQHISPG